MNIKKIILIVAGIASMVQLSAQQIKNIELASPLQYEKQDGRLMVKACIICTDVNAKTEVRINGNPAAYEKNSCMDSIYVWMPMVGKDYTFELRNGKKTSSSFKFASPINSDWGYFQNGTIHIIQSSHQDIAWMDTPEYCRNERINDIIVPALDMMKEDKDFTFEMEQTLNLMEFLEAYPDRKDEVIQRYKEGRFFWGATYNQPYEGLSSGEQLVRQAYFGRKWIKENLPGCDDVTATNMDVPGRAMQVPQIYAKSGIKNLCVARMDQGLYDWYSPDGTSLRVFCTAGNYGWAVLKWQFFDHGPIYAFQSLNKRLALFDGYYQKHHLAPHFAVLMSCDATKPVSFTEIIKQWNDIASLSETPLPSLKYSNSETYLSIFDTPETNLEKLRGERPDLWLYIHGPAHYEQTCDKRRAAVVLPTAELLSSYHYLAGADYPVKAIDRAWMASIYPDHGLGGKNGEITDGIFADSLAVGKNVGEKTVAEAMKLLSEKVSGKAGDIVLFNDLSWNRSSIAEVKVPYANVIVKDAEGKVLPVQMEEKDGANYVKFVADTPSAGYARFSISKDSKKKPASLASSNGDNYCSNKYYDIVFGNGGIIKLYDKELAKDILEGERYAFGDILDAGYFGNGAGEFTRITDLAPDGILLSSFASNWRKVAEGPLYQSYENEVQTQFTKIIQKITIYNTVKKIDFDVTLKDFNGEHNRQFRIMFPLKMQLKESDIFYQVPFAVSKVGRDELNRAPGGWGWGGTYVHNPKDTHPREVENFISANGNGFGCTMSSCVAVCDWIDPARDIASYPVLQGILLSSHKSCHGEGNWYHQTGTHSFHFSITSHAEGWKNGYAPAIEENHPYYQSTKNTDGKELPSSMSLITISDPFVNLSTMKKADNDKAIVIRLVEMEGVDKEISLHIPFNASKAVLCNMVEEEIKDIPVDGNTIHISIGHNAIETYKLYFTENL